MSFAQELLLLVLLMAISSFFSVSEIALAASRRLRLRVLANDGDIRAVQILAMQDNPGHFFTGIQIGVNAVAILAGILGEATLTPAFENIVLWFYPSAYSATIGLVMSFITITSLFILFADLIPKRLAMASPEAVALRVIGPMQWIIRILKPLVWAFDSLSDRLMVALGLPGQRSDEITSEDIHAVMEAGTQAGIMHMTEQQVIGNVFDLESRLVTSAMTTRESIIYFTLQESEAELRALIGQHAHSKFMVCDDVIDRMVGYADSKDLLLRIINNEPLILTGAPWIKPIMTVPDTLTLSELLTQFRQGREDFAIVLNEYALVVGLITLNDVMNTVMGDLVSANQQQIVRRDDKSWLIDGFTPVETVMHVLAIDAFPDDENYETIAGFMSYQLRKTPKLTDSVEYAGFRFEVVDIENHRIDQLLVTQLDDWVVESPE